MNVPPPPGVRVIPARSAAEMRDAVMAEARNAAIVLMAAAVADWRPSSPERRKMKKEEGPPAFELEPTDDILMLLQAEAKDSFRVGFALETEDPVANGRKKLRAKDLL